MTVAGVVGTDTHGRQLAGTLATFADTTPILRAKGFSTPVKTRILAGGVHSAKQLEWFGSTDRPGHCGPRMRKAFRNPVADRCGVES